VESTFVKFLKREISGPIAVGRVRNVLAERLEAESNWVWLSFETFLKQQLHHPGIPADAYEDLTWLLRSGELVHDRRPDCFHIVEVAPPAGRSTRMNACIKVVAANRRMMLLSLFRIDAAGYRRLIRRATK
jgi:hypothetical protein